MGGLSPHLAFTEDAGKGAVPRAAAVVGALGLLQAGVARRAMPVLWGG
jgi:hypothetical protein